MSAESGATMLRPKKESLGLGGGGNSLLYDLVGQALECGRAGDEGLLLYRRPPDTSFADVLVLLRLLRLHLLGSVHRRWCAARREMFNWSRGSGVGGHDSGGGTV